MRTTTGRRGAAAAAALLLAGALGACGGASGATSAGASGTSGTTSAGPSGGSSGAGASGGRTGVTGSPSDEPTLPPSRTTPATEPGPRAPAACRTPLGASTGPAAPLVTVRLTQVRVTGGATSGSLAATAVLDVRSDGPRIVLQPATSGLAVVREGVVVGWSAGSGTAVPLPLAAGATYPAQVLPATAPLVDCDGGALPAGDYTVRAVVGYGGDPLGTSADGAAGRFSLVSDPVAVRIP